MLYTMEIGSTVRIRIHFAELLKCGILAAVASLAGQAAGQVEFVDPTIGNIGILLEPTRPAVFLPNSMVRMYPIRADALDERIASFPLTISSHRQEELCQYPRQSRGLDCVSRSKRLERGR